MKPKHKFNSGNCATLCNKCNVIITNRLSNHLLCNKCIEEYVYEYPHKSKHGFTQKEMEDMLKEFPDVNMEKFNLALMGNTGILEDEQFINYPWDVITALRCGIENRDLKFSEWD